MSDLKRKIYVGLLHYPMVDRQGKEVCTAVTNLDLHDIARSCKTFGISRYLVINPQEEQAKMVRSILDHWKQEVSQAYHPARAQALDLIQYAYTFNEALNFCAEESGATPYVAMPDARNLEYSVAYSEFSKQLIEGNIPGDTEKKLRSILILFGTGWGISPSFFKNVDCILAPIHRRPLPSDSPGSYKYNHLSVRAAAAIVLDRLFGV